MSPLSCAMLHSGAWWYRNCGAHSSLNGRYYQQRYRHRHDGVQWDAWKDSDYSLRFSEMKLRSA